MNVSNPSATSLVHTSAFVQNYRLCKHVTCTHIHSQSPVVYAHQSSLQFVPLPFPFGHVVIIVIVIDLAHFKAIASTLISQPQRKQRSNLFKHWDTNTARTTNEMERTLHGKQVCSGKRQTDRWLYRLADKWQFDVLLLASSCVKTTGIISLCYGEAELTVVMADHCGGLWGSTPAGSFSMRSNSCLIIAGCYG